MTPTLTVRGLVADVGDEVCLVGARCEACDTHTFPSQGTCPRCGAAMSDVALPSTGTVWSWTVQRIEPKPPYVGPDDYEPFVVGYVDLGPVRVESRLEGEPDDGWAIGQPVRLRPGEPDSDGDVWRYRFVAEGADS